jgi:anti-anti-sigma factor
MHAIAPSPSGGLGPPKPLAATITHNRLILSTTWITASIVRITASGDIDASNACELARYVFRRSANCRHLILDLQGIDFFGTAGFTTLRNVESECARASVTWTLVPSRAVSRVLEICDTRSTLPLTKP